MGAQVFPAAAARAVLLLLPAALPAGSPRSAAPLQALRGPRRQPRLCLCGSSATAMQWRKWSSIILMFPVLRCQRIWSIHVDYRLASKPVTSCFVTWRFRFLHSDPFIYFIFIYFLSPSQDPTSKNQFEMVNDTTGYHCFLELELAAGQSRSVPLCVLSQHINENG